MWISFLLIAVTGTLLDNSRRIAADDCVQLSTCSCQSKQGLIDLSPLANRNGTPRFHDVISLYPYVYSWNPCDSFDEGSCHMVAACQLNVHSHQYYSLGVQDSASFLSENGQTKIVYRTTEHPASVNIKRTLYVTLECVDEAESRVSVVGERSKQIGVYDMTLFSKYACPVSSTSSKFVVSVGTILLIVTTSVVVLYIVGGVAFQVFVKKASGSHVVPHLSFWSAIPGLTKDGCLLVLQKCKLSDTYQQLS